MQLDHMVNIADDLRIVRGKNKRAFFRLVQILHELDDVHPGFAVEGCCGLIGNYDLRVGNQGRRSSWQGGG